MTAPDLMGFAPQSTPGASKAGLGPVRCWCRPRGGTSLSTPTRETADELAALLAAVQAGTWDGPTAAAYVAIPYLARGWCSQR